MRGSPSIVPDDVQDTYLVLDDFGRNGRAWREADVEDTRLETVITDLLKESIKILCGWWASTRGRAGHRTCPPTLRTSCGSDATSRCATCRFTCKTSWTGMKVGTLTCSYPCQSALSDPWPLEPRQASKRRSPASLSPHWQPPLQVCQPANAGYMKSSLMVTPCRSTSGMQ